MEKIFLTRLLFFMAFVFTFTVTFAKDKEENNLEYSIKSSGSGQQGYWIVEVTAFVEKKKDINSAIILKCAVHGALFKGVSQGEGGTAQKPICGASAESQNADFFNAFFQKDYKNFAEMVAGSLSTAKVNKGYEVTATVNIAKDNLRKAMEQAGVVRKLGF